MSPAPSFYPYQASQAAAILFQTLFSCWTASHLYLSWVYANRQRNKHRYMLVALFAVIVYVCGYSMRLASVNDPKSIPNFAAAATLTIAGTNFVCITQYLIFRYLIRSYLPEEQQTIWTTDLTKLPYILIFRECFILVILTVGSAIGSSGLWMGTSLKAARILLVVGFANEFVDVSLFSIALVKVFRKIKGNGGPKLKAQKVLIGLGISNFCIEVSVDRQMNILI